MQGKYPNEFAAAVGSLTYKAAIFGGFLLWALSGSIFIFTLMDRDSFIWPVSNLGKSLFLLFGVLQVPVMIYALVLLYRQKVPSQEMDAPLPHGVVTCFRISCALLASFWLTIFFL